MDRRPGAVTVVGWLAFLMALLQVFATIAAVVLIVAPGERQFLYGAPVSDWYWLFSGILSAILAGCYVWLGRNVWAGNPAAWAVVNMLAVINLFFALLNLAYGLGFAAILVNVGILFLNNFKESRAFFGQA